MKDEAASVALLIAAHGVRVKVVQPGLAPTTQFATNSGGRCDAALPSDYLDYAGRYLKSCCGLCHLTGQPPTPDQSG